MHATLRRVILAITLAALLLGTAWGAPTLSAQAQTAPRLSNLIIDVWPEFDRPASALVIYRGEFAIGTAIPELVKIRIPASAGDPFAVASPETGKETAPVNQWTDLIATKKVTTTRSGDWTEVTFAPLSRLFTIEFYDKLDTITFDRLYTVTWPGDLVADSATLNVREPFGATGFQSTPALPPGTRDDEGLIAHQLVLGPLNAGQALRITLVYHREDPRTSVQALQLVTPVPTQPASGIAGTDLWSSWPLIVALVVGMALIAGGIIWYLRSQSARFRPYTPPRYTKRLGRRSVRTGGALRSRSRPIVMRPVENDQVFCTQCGKQLTSEDTFCSRCGTRVKGK